MWQHRSKHHNLLACIQLICTVPSTESSTEGTALVRCYWYREECDEEAETAHIAAFKNVSNTITVAGRSIYVRKETILKESRLNNYNILYLSEIKCFQELFETTTYKRHIVISLRDVVQWLGYGLYDRGATVIFFSKAIRTALQPTRSPIQWESGTLFPTENWPNCEVFHIFPSSADDQKAKATPSLHPPTPPIMASYLDV